MICIVTNTNTRARYVRGFFTPRPHAHPQPPEEIDGNTALGKNGRLQVDSETDEGAFIFLTLFTITTAAPMSVSAAAVSEF